MAQTFLAIPQTFLAIFAILFHVFFKSFTNSLKESIGPLNNTIIFSIKESIGPLKLSYIENLSLAKALKIKQEKTKKTILIIRVDTAYPDLLCIYLDDLTKEERFNKPVKSLDLLDLFLIRHNVIQNIDQYKNRLFEIETEYDAFEFSHHESPKDDITRTRFIAAWISHYPKGVYVTKEKIKIPILNIAELWHNLIKEIQIQRL